MVKNVKGDGDLVNNKKIVLDARMIDTSGIGRYIKALVPVLINNFSSVTLLGIAADINKFEWANNVKVVEFKAPIYSIIEQIKIISKTPKCDIFIAPHYNVPIFLPQAKKVVVTIHDSNHLVFKNDLSFAKRIYARIFYYIATRKDIIFTVSEFSKSEILKYTKCNSDKILIAKLAVDKPYFEALDGQSENLDFLELDKYKDIEYVLYIGNVKPHKNLKRSILAFDLASKIKPGLKFLVVGKMDNFLTGDNEIFKLLEDSPRLKHNVKFTGQISDLNLAFLYKHAKVFLFPSLYEGFGLPPLEAMAFGCPVIVSKEGSLPEICGNAAYYCDAYDVNNIAEAIVAVLLENDLRNDLIDKGFEKIKEYDWAYFNKAILNGLIPNNNM